MNTFTEVTEPVDLKSLQRLDSITNETGVFCNPLIVGKRVYIVDGKKILVCDEAVVDKIETLSVRNIYIENTPRNVFKVVRTGETPEFTKLKELVKENVRIVSLYGKNDVFPVSSFIYGEYSHTSYDSVFHVEDIVGKQIFLVINYERSNGGDGYNNIVNKHTEVFHCEKCVDNGVDIMGTLRGERYRSEFPIYYDNIRSNSRFVEIKEVKIVIDDEAVDSLVMLRKEISSENEKLLALKQDILNSREKSEVLVKDIEEKEFTLSTLNNEIERMKKIATLEREIEEYHELFVGVKSFSIKKDITKSIEKRKAGISELKMLGL